MIREYQPDDLETIMTIWLKGNEQAHNFIDPEFFRKNYDLVKLLLPSSTVYVQDLNGVKGFIGLTDNYIAGLFVDENYRHQNIGKALIQKQNSSIMSYPFMFIKTILKLFRFIYHKVLK